MSELTNIRKLIEAMALVLEDCGATGKSVSLRTKAISTLAFEPFRESCDIPQRPPLIGPDEGYMSLTKAIEILDECKTQLLEEEEALWAI